MAFTYKDISTIWNNSIKQNEECENATLLAEDLSNLVDAGNYASNSVGLKHHYRNIIVGIHNFVLNRMLEENRFNLLRTAEEFGGGLQRIMASDNFTPQESHLLNLVSGVNYHDGKYYGLSASAKVFLKTETFKVVHSKAEDFEATMFTTSEELANWFGLVAVTERNTIIQTLSALEKRIINRIIVSCEEATTPRVVKLITLFNTMIGATSSTAETLATLKADREKWAYFASFCKEVIARLIDYVREPNKKYNDGSVLTYTPPTKTEIVLITEFATDIKYLANPIEFTPAEIVSYKTVPWWQGGGTSFLPDYSITSSIVVPDGEETTTYSNIVGVIYDIDGAGIEVKNDKVTVEPVGSEGFTNYHHHIANRYYIDERLASVVLELA